MFGDGFSTPPCRLNPCICGRRCDQTLKEEARQSSVPSELQIKELQIKLAMAITNAIFSHLKDGDFGLYCPGAMSLLETQFKGSIGEVTRKAIEGFKL